MNEYRKNLIELIVKFLVSCKKLDGIYRIAMIGSLISEKERPEDVENGIVKKIFNDAF